MVLPVMNIVLAPVRIACKVGDLVIGLYQYMTNSIFAHAAAYSAPRPTSHPVTYTPYLTISTAPLKTILSLTPAVTSFAFGCIANFLGKVRTEPYCNTVREQLFQKFC
jgi:hypothetical protein